MAQQRRPRRHGAAQAAFVALLLCTAVAGSGRADQLEPSPGMEPDTDRPGSDFASFEVLRPDPTACRAACLVQKRCAAWTYVHPGVQGPNARCWLKSQVPQAVPHACCISGVSPAAGTADPADPKAACEAAGGTWGPGGLLADPLCFYPQPDAGKPCLRQGDCSGHCLIGSGEYVAGTPGQCSRIEPLFGCFDYLDDQGRQAGICID